ncbi:hypothetical protein [Streptomyces sp. V4I8]|uniref:hypothetical protein n=1 Tax=Streptomyces sp. V4I8 TaxID=3156469 RepID=UPI0035164AF0
MGGTRKPLRTPGPADRPRAGARRWAARLALLVAAGAIALLLTAAGGRSLALLVVGLAGLAATAAALWWTLARHGAARAVAAALAALVPLAVLVSYAAAGLLWVVLSVLVLWAVAMLIGRAALAADIGPAGPGSTRPHRPRRRSSS